MTCSSSSYSRLEVAVVRLRREYVPQEVSLESIFVASIKDIIVLLCLLYPCTLLYVPESQSPEFLSYLVATEYFFFFAVPRGTHAEMGGAPPALDYFLEEP